MLRRLFLSIIILSALASEGGAPYSAGLLDYYLINLNHLDMMMQDSRDTVPVFDVQKLNTINKKGTPAAFFKALSQDAINAKSSNKRVHPEFLWFPILKIVLTITIVLLVFVNICKFYKRRTLLSLADSSPPVYC